MSSQEMIETLKNDISKFSKEIKGLAKNRTKDLEVREEKARVSRTLDEFLNEGYKIFHGFKEQQQLNSTKHQHLVESLRTQKEQEDKIKLIHSAMNDANEFKIELEKEIELLRNDKASILFPLSRSNDLQERLIGEVQINSALQYVATTRPIIEFEQDIENALDMGRIDFANKVLESIIGRRVNDKTSPKTVELRTRLQELSEELYNETPLSSIEEKIREITNLRRDTKNFIKALSNDQLMFFTVTESRLNPSSVKYGSLEEWEADVEIYNS